ncbi:MAG: glycoside hydrolase family 26 protein [Chloroflexota bacterium]
MKTQTEPSRANRHMRALSLMVVSLSFLLLAGSLPAAADVYDPTQPTNNKEAGANPPGSGGPARRVALGMADPEGQSAAAVDAFIASVGGKKPATWVIWSQWGRPVTKAFPTALANALKARDITPTIWWEPVDPRDLSDPTYARHKNIIRGDHDAYIRQWARDARAFGAPVLVRFAHEINNNYFPWSVNSFDNSPATFKAAWRRVYSIFRSEGATNVKFVWSVAKKKCSGCNPYAEVYPGDNYVDYMAFSGYNWGAIKGKKWLSMYESYRIATNKLAEISNKPIIVAETASNSIGGDKVAWIRDGYREVYRKLPQISSIVYLSADLRDVGHPDWRITSPAKALKAYAEIMALGKFDTRMSFGSTRRSQMARTDREDSETRKHKSSATDATRDKAPRVRKGTAVDDGSRDPRDGEASKIRSRTTKRPKKKAPDPVATLDSFGR